MNNFTELYAREEGRLPLECRRSRRIFQALRQTAFAYVLGLFLSGCETVPGATRSAATMPSKATPAATGYSETVTAVEPVVMVPTNYVWHASTKTNDLAVIDPAPPHRQEMPQPDTMPQSAFLNPMTGMATNVVKTNVVKEIDPRCIRPKTMTDTQWAARKAEWKRLRDQKGKTQ